MSTRHSRTTSQKVRTGSLMAACQCEPQTVPGVRLGAAVRTLPASERDTQMSWTRVRTCASCAPSSTTRLSERCSKGSGAQHPFSPCVCRHTPRPDRRGKRHHRLDTQRYVPDCQLSEWLEIRRLVLRRCSSLTSVVHPRTVSRYHHYADTKNR